MHLKLFQKEQFDKWQKQNDLIGNKFTDVVAKGCDDDKITSTALRSKLNRRTKITKRQKSERNTKNEIYIPREKASNY